MKRLFIGLLLVLFISVLRVNASKILITIPNIIDDEYICDSDYIHSSDVDWKEVGIGKVNFYSKEDMQNISKEVLITDLVNLEKGVNVPINKHISIDEAITVKRIINVDESEFYVLGCLDAAIYPYSSEFDKEFAYIGLYKNNVLQWSKIIKETRYGTLKDGVIIDDGIAVIGEYDSINQQANVFIMIISSNGDIIYDKEIQGSLNDFATNIYYNQGMLIFCGVSESKNKDFYAYTNAGYDIFIGNIPLDTKELNIHLVGNSGNDLLIDSVYDNGYLYIYTYLKGKGFFFNNYTKEENFKCIIEVDDRFEFNNFVACPDFNNEANDNIFVFNSFIVISNFTYGSNTLSFKLYNKRLEFMMYKSFKVSDVSSLIDYKIIVDADDLYLTTLAIKGSSSIFNTSHNLDNEFKEKSSYEAKSTNKNSSLIDFDYIDGKLKINIIDKSSSTMNILDYSYIFIKSNRKEHQDYYLDDYDIYVNGKIIDKKLYTTSAPQNAFGLYNDLYSARVGDLEIVLPIEKYYYPKINLKNKEKYDLGIVLKFNGKGYLNDEVIDNNYKIKEAGKYVLEIRGNNDERKVINFDVEELSLEPGMINDYNNNPISTQKEHDLYLEKMEISLDQKNNDEIDKFAIIIIFSLASIGIILGIVLPMNLKQKLRRRKKNV